VSDGTDRAVYWFVGGPLDGRVHTREPADPAPAVVRHVHLHDGPKIVHVYDLHEVAGHGGEYRLRGPEDEGPSSPSTERAGMGGPDGAVPDRLEPADDRRPRSP
jgi:hypothetical protein